MDSFEHFITWFLCLAIGVPFGLVGCFHFVFPETAWGMYRWWHGLFGSDPQSIAPEYRYALAMRIVGLTLIFGGLSICGIPMILDFF
ncbi:hypothetical protein OAL43_03240 [bacterium]|nr:hypothetical protein [bacterium]MDC0279198.1 hypothetical protein [bacterium]MDC0295554.1 hypothetical protein [bacterium]